MVNFSVEQVSDVAKILTDASGRKLLLSSNAQKSKYDVDLAVKVPINRAVASSPIELGYALRLDQEAGNVLDSFKGVVSGTVLDKFTGIIDAAEAHLILPELLNRLKAGKLLDIRDGNAFTRANPDIVFTFMYPHDEPALLQTIAQAGLPYAVEDAWYEPSIINRAKWLEFFAQFFNLQKEAELVTKRIAKEIEETTKQSRAKGQHVLWFVDLQGYVAVTGGGSWVGQAVRDLGGKILTPNSRSLGSVDSNREWVAGKLPEADVIVFNMFRPMMGFLSSIYPNLKDSPAYKQKRIYGFSLPYWQEGAYAPEKWFKELAVILQPEQMPALQDLTLFVQAR
jgi:iron complex transport system substrate-binding protein